MLNTVVVIRTACGVHYMDAHKRKMVLTIPSCQKAAHLVAGAFPGSALGLGPAALSPQLLEGETMQARLHPCLPAAAAAAVPVASSVAAAAAAGVAAAVAAGVAAAVAADVAAAVAAAVAAGVAAAVSEACIAALAVDLLCGRKTPVSY